MNASNAARTFSMSDGQTFWATGSDEEHLADFQLRLIAKLVRKGVEKEGYWLAELKTKEGTDFVSKEIIVPSNAFDTTAKLVTHLRSAWCGGTFHFSISQMSLQFYFEGLKRDFMDRYRVMGIVDFIGQQAEGEWVFSHDAHVYDGNITAVRKHQIVSARVKEMGVKYPKMGTKLKEDLMEVISSAREAYKGNFNSFMLAMGFAAFSILKERFAEENCHLEGHPIAVIYSSDKNVGKTSALTSIAMLIGVENPHRHPSVCAEGNACAVGVSAKLLATKLSRTGLIVFVDDASLTGKLFGELIVATFGGFAQGSNTVGALHSRGSLMFTANEMPHDDRVTSRIVTVRFVSTGNADAEQHVALRRCRRACKRAVGVLNSYCLEAFDTSADLDDGILEWGLKFINEHRPSMQHRQAYGLAMSAYMSAKIQIFAGDDRDVCSLMREHIQEDGGKCVINALFDYCIEKMRTEPDLVLTWLNPKASVRGQPAVAIWMGIIDEVPGLVREDIRAACHQNGAKTWQVTERFASCAGPTTADLRRRTPGTTHGVRSFKFVRSNLPDGFNRAVCAFIEHEDRSRVDGESEQLPDQETVAPEHSGDETSTDVIDEDPAVTPIIEHEDRSRVDGENQQLPDKETVVPEHRGDETGTAVIDESPVMDKRNHSPTRGIDETPTCTPAFEAMTISSLQGSSAHGHGRKSRKCGLGVSVRINDGYSYSPEEKKNGGESSMRVSGTVGVRRFPKRKLFEKTAQQESAPKTDDSELCKRCHSTGRDGQLWVACDTCDSWFHISCVGIRRRDEIPDEWYCDDGCRRAVDL